MSWPEHPLKNEKGEWRREECMAIILPRLEEMDMPTACKLQHKGRGLPTVSTVTRWLGENPQWAEEVARARKIRAAKLVDESLALADAPAERKPDGSVDAGAIRHTEMRINQRRWVAERLDRNQWGQQLQVDMNVHASIDIAGVLAEARGRVIEGRAERVADSLPPGTEDLFE